jgi:hypothetical protein
MWFEYFRGYSVDLTLSKFAKCRAELIIFKMLRTENKPMNWNEL